MGSKPQRRFTAAFKSEAVRLALTSRQPHSQVAEDLGIGFSTLNRWVRQDREAKLMGSPHDDSAKELKRLRRENQLLRAERDLLKKAAVFFAKESR